MRALVVAFILVSTAPSVLATCVHDACVSEARSGDYHCNDDTPTGDHRTMANLGATVAFEGWRTCYLDGQDRVRDHGFVVVAGAGAGPAGASARWEWNTHNVDGCCPTYETTQCTVTITTFVVDRLFFAGVPCNGLGASPDVAWGKLLP